MLSIIIGIYNNFIWALNGVLNLAVFDTKNVVKLWKRRIY